MKYAFLILFAVCSRAAAQANIQNVHEVATSTNSIIQSIALSGVLTDVANVTSSGTLAGSFAIEVFNQAASSSTINCGFDVMLSTAQGNVWYGREIPAGVGIIYQVSSARKVYCRSQQTVGTNPVTISQFK